MKKGFLALAILSGATALVLSACADDVIDVTNQEKYAIVDELDSGACTEEMEGAMQLVKSEGLLYACSDGEWFVVNPDEAVDYRCKSEPLKDSTGYRIFCDGEEIGVIQGGKDGKDASKSDNGSDGKSAYEIAKDNGYTGSEEDWKKLQNGADGKSAYEIAKENGYSGSEEDWEKLQNGSDGKNGKTLYEIAKENGFTGTEEEFLKSLDGKDAKTVDGDSVSGDIEGDITQPVTDSLKCKIDTTSVDTEKSEIKVKVTCGNGSSELTLPILVPNKNLSTHYKKHVVVRIPVGGKLEEDADDDNNPDWLLHTFNQLWSELQIGQFAELTVREVDEKFDQTGKRYIADLAASSEKLMVSVDEMTANTLNYHVVRLEGDIDVTNLMNSYAQLRVSLDFTRVPRNNPFSSTNTQVAFNAFVDFDESDTVVIDFLTDYKAARVKELLKSKDFVAAGKQANADLVKALHISDDASKYPAFEHYLPTEVGNNEQFASTLWLAALLSSDTQNFNTVYADYRALFAKDGNFNTALKETFNGKERSMFLVDFEVMLLNAYREGCDKSEECSIYDSPKFKAVQAGLRDAYELPEASKDTFVEPKVGYFKYIVYDSVRKNWYPVTRQDLLNWNAETLLNIIAGIDECNENHLRATAKLTFEGVDYVMECDGERDYFDWTFSAAYKACAGKDDGTYILLNKGDEDEYYRCFEVQGQDGKTVMTATSVSAMDYYAGKSCNLDAEDALYTLPSSSNSNGGSSNSQFFHCYKASHTVTIESSPSTVDDSEYEILDPSNIYDFNVIVALQKGTCTSENVNKNSMVSVFDRPGHSVWAECDANLWTDPVTYRWKRLDALNAAATAAEGACDEEKMGQHGVYSVDVAEWDISTLTQHMNVKCDCEKEDEYTQYCDWMAADALDVKIGEACDFASHEDPEFAEMDDDIYVCDVIFSGSSTAEWKESWTSKYCEYKYEELKPLEGTTSELYKCNYKGITYVSSSQYGEWRDFDSYCTHFVGRCNENMTSSMQSVCMFMEGFVGETPYKCNRTEGKWEEITVVEDYCENANPWELNNGNCGPINSGLHCLYANNTHYACCETAAANGETSAKYGWVPVEGANGTCPASED